MDDLVELTNIPTIEVAWQDRIADVMTLHSYQSDWDGLGASAPNIELIIGTFKHLRGMRGYRPPDSIGPTTNGGILIFWQSDDAYLEAEISTLGRTEWMEMKSDSEPRHWIELWLSPDQPVDE